MELGSNKELPDNVFTDSNPIELGIVIGGVEMTPRQQLTSVPRAVNAARLGGRSDDEIVKVVMQQVVPRITITRNESPNGAITSRDRGTVFYFDSTVLDNIYGAKAWHEKWFMIMTYDNGANKISRIKVWDLNDPAIEENAFGRWDDGEDTHSDWQVGQEIIILYMVQ